MEAETEKDKAKIIEVRCCIAGGGPAGVMLGYLLARAGISVAVLEKWPDFLRDFRGDTIHPSTMQLLHELGILDEFLALKHNETRQMAGHIGNRETIIADFSHLPVKCPFVAFIPQSDFLNFMVKQARQFPGFGLFMETEATEILRDNGKVTGIKAKGPKGEMEFRAELTVGADGRNSTIRRKAGLEVIETGVPFDVAWFSLPRKSDKKAQSLGYINEGKIMIMLDRDDYWQCGFVLHKGDFEQIKARGLEQFRNGITGLAPFVAEAVREITSWEQVKLLTVKVDHLAQWYQPGLLCIGDSAHAMSPVGGVGINLAIQDAVAAANILIPAFKKGVPTVDDLAAVQQRRSWSASVTQRVQVFAHTHVIDPVLNRKIDLRNPWPLKLYRLFPFLTRIPGWAIGIGLRPEHVRN